MNRSSLRSLPLIPTHDQIEKYLISTGWVFGGDLANVASIWHHPSNEDAELLLPRVGVARDYDERIIDLLNALANFEGTQILDAVESIDNFTADLVKVRVIGEDVRKGTIPLDDGVLLHQHARDLMAAAASSTSSRKKYFSGTRTPETNDYVGHLRLGQSAIGSYIINIISPVDIEVARQATSDTTSFSRMVTHTLASSLNALHTATLHYFLTNDIEEYAPTIEQGASANMCEALLGLSGGGHLREFSITIVPSKTQKMPSENLPLQFSFGTQHLFALQKAAEYFKENYVSPNKSIIGMVQRLDRVPGAGNGSITVNCLLNYFEKKVIIELSEQEYNEAISAHKNKKPVTCNGDLHVSQRSARLLNPHNFRVLGNEELFQPAP